MQGFSTKFTPWTPFNSKHLQLNRLKHTRLLQCYDSNHLYAVLLFLFEQQFWTAFWNFDTTFFLVSGAADFLTIWSAGLTSEAGERVFSKVLRNLQGLATKLTPENSFNSKHLNKNQ